MATYAPHLAAAQAALLQVLSGVAVEWHEGGHRVRVTTPAEMMKIIEQLQRLVDEEAGGSCLRPIVDL